ncbi:type III polyketide synthase [Metabacillus idriensis]|uniref:type III polyketide synthase n=1 Tax=Metabacillus idriensis TaxID=324768 RepID=UPI00174B1884|nr:3-oxoacyl-[acyl-carrier-protein] synthase III C-terminal domain-containing protein [Metabacillus idriensis]
MAYILSVGKSIPPNKLPQEATVEFAKELFEGTFKDINRLLPAFKNGDIESRQFVKNLEWYTAQHSFEDKNNTYIEAAVALGSDAIVNCLTAKNFLKRDIAFEEIDVIFFISSTGISTPSIDAKIMNQLPFRESTKRVPIWGLGCAGGASGLARAHDYCKAYPQSKVLVVCVELCSLTFQHDDLSKSNFIGTSLFADGVACTLLAGEDVLLDDISALINVPKTRSTRSTFMKDSEEVMGWDIKNNGFYVIFSRDIPSIIKNWLRETVEKYLEEEQVPLNEIKHFLAHPGGKKVLQAYQASLGFEESQLEVSKNVLRNHGNMSSATVMYVIEQYLTSTLADDSDLGIIAALGPGFCSELLLVEWEKVA